MTQTTQQIEAMMSDVRRVPTRRTESTGSVNHRTRGGATSHVAARTSTPSRPLLRTPRPLPPPSLRAPSIFNCRSLSLALVSTPVALSLSRSPPDGSRCR